MRSTPTSTSTSSTGSATKALIAAGLGVVLLAGAGGTFALWNAEETTATGTITDGELSLEVAAGTWTDGATAIDPATFRMVPGDTVTFSTTVVPTIIGDNLVATLTGSLPQGEQAHWSVVANLPAGETFLDAADSGVPVAVSVEVSLPVSSDNTSQAQVLPLSDLTLNLQQVDPTL
ncbi:alternate-type signal peptide domain-containing protein [Ornithinimicrobium murale]|uniref:alternate-type signal peptide domain-containing protein n=1 Tax=Ornithinimicrobium murale TaxID=1050153 RepID=UPI000E0DEF5D|nr:alternate-type signal peptide domain-containing protein [Ornithinimicrobium murale]